MKEKIGRCSAGEEFDQSVKYLVCTTASESLDMLTMMILRPTSDHDELVT